MVLNRAKALSIRSLREATQRFGANMLRRPALRDLLTGLPNHNLLNDRLGQELARARRDGGMVAVMRLDVEIIKEINATLGVAAGDQLLRSVAHRLCAAIRATDTLARLDGGEFALMQPQVRELVDAGALVAKLQGVVEGPFDLDDHVVDVTLSIGVALFPQDGQDPETLLKHADLALYRATAQGLHQFRFFEPAMDEEAQARRRIERELRQALKRGEFVLHYQPQLALASGRFTGAEALVRWNHPERGLVPPSEFIPFAETNGLIRPLGEWVLGAACRQASIWREHGWDLSVAVNLSPAQLRQGRCLPAVNNALSQADLEPARLELEITEGVLMENVEQRGDGFLHGLTADGVRLALDDFGIGYSSLAYLRHLPVKTIKIDRSFVRDLGQDADAEALVRAIVMLGHGLRMRVVAEGVENETQLDLLRALGCDEVQGFFIARPMDAGALERLLASESAFAGPTSGGLISQGETANLTSAGWRSSASRSARMPALPRHTRDSGYRGCIRRRVSTLDSAPAASEPAADVGKSTRVADRARVPMVIACEVDRDCGGRPR